MQSWRRNTTFSGEGCVVKASCVSGAAPVAMSRRSCFAAVLTVSHIVALRASVCVVRASKSGLTIGETSPLSSARCDVQGRCCVNRS